MLIAGVVSDEMLRAVKGIEPVIPTVERAEIVRSSSTLRRALDALTQNAMAVTL